MGKMLVQCAYSDCSKKFLFDFGQSVLAPSLSFVLNCPHCEKINVLTFKVAAKTEEDLPVLWAPCGSGVIIRLKDSKTDNDVQGKGIKNGT